MMNATNQSQIDQWFDEHFSFNDTKTTYWFSLNPICDEDWSSFPLELVSFLNLNNSCPLGTTCDSINANGYDLACPPRQHGDGKCDTECLNPACSSDNGDCMMLCFSPELANCSLAKIDNNQCDKGCENVYCGHHDIGSNFAANAIFT